MGPLPDSVDLAGTGTRSACPDRRPNPARSDPPRSASARVSTLDRVTLQLGVVVAALIALCSYAVSATSLYALGVQAGYSWWQAAAVPVVADGPAIAAAIPLAVLAMLEGLKGDAGEVTRLTAQAADPAHAPALERPGQIPQGTTVRRTDTTALLDSAGAADGSRRPALPAGPSPTDRSMVGARLQAAYAQRRPDGQPWTARTLAETAGCGRSSAAAFLQRQRPPAAEPMP